MPAYPSKKRKANSRTLLDSWVVGGFSLIFPMRGGGGKKDCQSKEKKRILAIQRLGTSERHVASSSSCHLQDRALAWYLMYAWLGWLVY